tara:strand:- start:2150 stop:4180 length:2031 start_codon:yes stop_codon:yes gene_type:complete
MKMKKLFVLVLLSNFLVAQKDSLQTVKLDEIEVKSIKSSTILESVPMSITKIKIPKLWSKQQLSLQEYINSVPGLLTLNANNFAQDLRISIRGFGSRSAFGIRGIKIIIDGIPETTPDGQGQLDNLPLQVIDNIEVIRGSSSLRYGNASGGVIFIETLNKIENNFHELGFRGAQNNYKQTYYTSGLKLENSDWILHLNHQNGDGFRENSSFESTQFNVRGKYFLTNKTRLGLQFNSTNSPLAEDPGGQNYESFKNSPSKARDRNILFKSGEKINHVKTAVNINYENGNFLFSSYSFISNRTFNAKLPFNFGGIVNLNRNYYGHGSYITKKNNANKIRFTTQVGYDIANQSDKRKRYKNNEGDRGEKTLGQIESFKSYGIYFIENISFGRFKLNGGIRWDNNFLKVEDEFFSNGDDSGNIKLSAWSNEIGLSYKILDKSYFFVNSSQSYETPTLSELSANPSRQGGFNDLLNVQKAKNFDFGLNFKSESTNFSIIGFIVSTKNDLIPYEVAEFPGRTFYKNAGKTLRRGIEIDFNYRLSKKFSTSIVYNYTNFKYDEYLLDGLNLKGNYIPGIPTSFGNFELKYNNSKNISVIYSRNYRGNLYANDNNSEEISFFWRDDVSLSIPVKFGKNYLDLFFGCNNMFNKLYADNIRINAFGNRYYEAAPGRIFFTGIKILF